eukprot:2861496-Rhodomonas_salina.4
MAPRWKNDVNQMHIGNPGPGSPCAPAMQCVGLTKVVSEQEHTIQPNGTCQVLFPSSAAPVSLHGTACLVLTSVTWPGSPQYSLSPRRNILDSRGNAPG